MTSSTLPSKLPYPIGEEIANAITHGIGALLSIAGLVVLILAAAKTGDVWHIVSFSLFGASAILLYTMSTLYHAIVSPGAKRVLKILDHSTIYTLIAGTYTPFALVPLRPTIGWWIFGVVWGVAIAGIATKPFMVGKMKALSTLVYVAMGWIVVFAWKPLVAATEPRTVALLIAGGIAYTAGAGVYLIRGKAWSHPLWHVFVGAGTALHFFSVLSLLA